MNMHHITKSLFVGAAIAGIGMSSGKAEIKFAPAARQQLERIIQNRLREYYDKLYAVAPGNFTRDDLDECLKNDLSAVMCTLLDTNFLYEPSFFQEFQNIFYTSEDPEEQRLWQPFEVGRERFKDPNEFAWKFFRHYPRCCEYFKSRLGDLLSLARNHGRADIGNALVREGFAEKVPGYEYFDKNANNGFTFEKKELDIFDRDTLRRMMDIYYPEAAKSFAARTAFNYSMYVFFDRIFPPTNCLYAMASAVFESECEYRRVKDRTANRVSCIAVAGKLKEILASVDSILLACMRGGVFCGGEEHFIFRTGRKGRDDRFSDNRKEEEDRLLDNLKEACEAFGEVVRKKAKELDQKIEAMLRGIRRCRSMMHIWADSDNR